MQQRHFLFLQGPHGPFFHALSRKLLAAGQAVHKIGINQGDAFFWPDAARYTRFTDPLEAWPEFLEAFVRENGVTDLVIYGDAREFHQMAAAVAKRLDLRLHCFEEGYLRPYWVTYERGGSNGNSPLMALDMADIVARLGPPEQEQAEAPAQWGPVWHHTILGSLYHANILFRNGKYPNFRSHRRESVRREWLLHCKRLALYGPHAVAWRVATARLLRRGLPYHVALLQLAHDASVQHYSSIRSMGEFARICIEGFAAGAPPHHQLVFKTHPLEDGREPLRRIIREHAEACGIGDRVWLIHGGRLGLLLDRARSAVTVNSTAGQQALWRGLPVKTFGRAVYVKPEFVSQQQLAEFFERPDAPDQACYRAFRQFLLATSQVSGGFYTAAGRRNACRLLVDRMLSDRDPYAIGGDSKDTLDVKLELVNETNLTA